MQYFINYEVLNKYKSRLYLSSIRLNFFKKFVDSDFKVRSEEYSVYIRLHAPSCSLPPDVTFSISKTWLLEGFGVSLLPISEDRLEVEGPPHRIACLFSFYL